MYNLKIMFESAVVKLYISISSADGDGLMALMFGVGKLSFLKWKLKIF